MDRSGANNSLLIQGNDRLLGQSGPKTSIQRRIRVHVFSFFSRATKLRRAYHSLLFLSKRFCYRRSRKGREALRCKPHSQDNNGWKLFRFDKEELESCSPKL